MSLEDIAISARDCMLSIILFVVFDHFFNKHLLTYSDRQTEGKKLDDSCIHAEDFQFQIKETAIWRRQTEEG